MRSNFMAWRTAHAVCILGNHSGVRGSIMDVVVVKTEDSWESSAEAEVSVPREKNISIK